MRIACSLSAARRVLLALAGFLLLTPAAEAAVVRAPRDTIGNDAARWRRNVPVHWWSGHEEQGFIPQLRHFARQILDGVPPQEASPAAGVRDGIASLAVLEAVRRSLSNGLPVAVPAAAFELAPAAAGATGPWIR